MRVPIETERLILRPFEAVDAQAAYGWFGDPVVMRFTPGGPDKGIEETTTRLANYREHQIARGFGKWITLDRRTMLAITGKRIFLNGRRLLS